MGEEQDRRVYRLEDEEAHEWTDFDDDEVYPQQPRISTELRPWFTAGEEVEELDDLTVYGFMDPPTFASSAAIEATPQELAEWKAAGERYLDVAGAFRNRMAEAARRYEETYEEGVRELRAALAAYKPVEEQLKSRGTELAAKLHEHREAARKWKEERREKEQTHLDTIHGPRVTALYKPESLSSRKQTDHIAKVHLTDCKRRAKRAASVGQVLHDDEGLRADEAWRRLTNPDKWIRSVWGDLGKNMRVKFCSFCKPWTVFQEHLDDFPRPLYNSRMEPFLGEVQLTDIPDAWVDVPRETSGASDE